MQELKSEAEAVTKKAVKIARKKVDVASGKIKKQVQKTRDVSLDDLKNMSDAAIKKLVKEIDIETLAIALKNAEKELVDKIIPNLGVRVNKQFQELQSQVSKFNKTEIKKYQRIVETKLKSFLK
ncbi:MAG: FliG C-terminal domain-containing protein [Bacteroidales bacterium]|nr:FliG C-terminal domain-containing protein [Bacteroidales bacterium]